MLKYVHVKTPQCCCSFSFNFRTVGGAVDGASMSFWLLKYLYIIFTFGTLHDHIFCLGLKDATMLIILDAYYVLILFIYTIALSWTIVIFTSHFLTFLQIQTYLGRILPKDNLVYVQLNARLPDYFINQFCAASPVFIQNFQTNLYQFICAKE